MLSWEPEGRGRHRRRQRLFKQPLPQDFTLGDSGEEGFLRVRAHFLPSSVRVDGRSVGGRGGLGGKLADLTCLRGIHPEGERAGVASLR